MKINFLSNPFKTCSSICLLLVGLMWTTDVLNAQCPPARSPTCRFVGTTATNDTIQPPLTVGLALGSCLGSITLPAPALNTPGCAFAADPTGAFVNGTPTVRSNVGCSFADGCNTCFGCQGVTITSVSCPVAPATNSNASTTNAYDINCGPVQCVMADGCTATFGQPAYTMLVNNCNVGTYRAGNGAAANDTLMIPKGTYNSEVIATNGFCRVQPSVAYGQSTFGEGIPTFTMRVPTTCCVATNDRTKNCTPPTISGQAGKYYVTWKTEANDGIVTGIQQVNIADLEPPTFIGCPKAVILNLGPGECQKSWDAPPLMAMDNCPAGNFVNAANSIGCQGSLNFCGYDGINPSGWIFNLTNNTANSVGILGFPSYYTGGCSGITSTNALFDLFEKTNANEGWEVGLVGYNGNPATSGCNGNSPIGLWTKVHTGVAADNIRATTITATSLDTLLLGASSTPTRDTVYKCDGTFTVNVGSGLSTNVILNPGEQRGFFLAGQLGTRFEPGNVGPFGSCNAGRPFGDGKMQISTGPIAGGLASNIANGFGTNFGICRPFGYVGNVMYATSDPMVRVKQTCGQPYGPGCYFPVGCKTLCYSATDVAGNVGVCTFQVCVNPYPNPVTALACHDEIQISLDQNCSATITADEVLAGGPYRCYDDYVVTIQDWNTLAVIDRNPNLAGVQLGVQDIGRPLRITVRDPLNGNSCWGHGTVEDKIAPKLTCPRDTCVPCYSDVTPTQTGNPTVNENCGSYSLSFKDNVTYYGCGLGFDRVITRTWTAVDPYGNKGSCNQVISVALGTLNDVTLPLNYDNIDNPMLKCNEKRDNSFDYTAHYLPYPYCVDGWLLDSTRWKATGGFYPSPTGDLAGVRLPRILGWNCIDTGAFQGHPSPFGQYYPAHPNWRANNPVCWGPDEQVLWAGTGYPGGANCKNLGVTFKDITIDLAKPNCNAGPVGCYKILRQWTVLDWCTSGVGGTNQIIKVADAVGPQILYPDTLIVNMESQSCLGRWEVSPAWLVDNCSVEVHYTVAVDDGVILGNETSGYVVVNMPAGIQNGYIVAEDCCGNISKRRIALNVVDNVPPNAVCEQRTVVSITGNQTPGSNFAKVFASSFDQGSFDNCAPHVFFKVIRMDQLRGTNNGSNTNQADNGTNCTGINGDDNAILDGNQIYFDDYVNFCCSDVGPNPIQVVFRVFDRDPGVGPVAPSRMNPGGQLFNRFSDCMVLVDVQDKTVPTVVAPPNIVVSCAFWFNIDNLDDPNDATFGKVVTDLGLRAKVYTNDIVCHKYCERNDITGYPGFVPGAPPSNPPAWNRACLYYQSLFDTAHFDRRYDLTWGFDGYVLSGCGNNPTISVNDNRECGQGQITRTVVARGPNGISVTATQTIWVVDCDPFYINRADNCDPNDDITWPGNCTGQATTIAGCGADISPDNPVLGRPTVQNNADDLCALISIEYTDEIFTIEPDACFKVLRHWTVIDWCQYDPSLDPTRGRWEYLQIIKVHDTDKPVVSINVGPCEPAVKNATDHICYGHLSITADATDNCSPADWLFYDYKIDLFNDGLGKYSGFDVKSGPLSRKQFAAGTTPQYHDNPYADDPNNPFDASGTYPVGIHKICWYVEDGCGNIGALCQLFEIKDCKAPTPYCLTGVITVPMPTSKCITIWAKDLDRGSFDNCTDQPNLKFYFNGDPTATSITICCDDFVAAGANDELVVDVQMWVEDEQGNKDYCKTVIIVQDNQDVCPNTGSLGRVDGSLKTENNNETEKADVELVYSNNSKMAKQMTTGSVGSYLFGELKPDSYTVMPFRNDDPKNGVTTADIVLIQRHILGIEKLNSPYKMIAADVNKSATITAADVSEIRKLILGTVTEFAKTQSWTFVPKGYVFDANSQGYPYNAPRTKDVTVVPKSKITEDFVAIKMGDVNGNAVAHSVTGSTSRNSGKLHLEIDNNSTVAGELYKVAFKSSDFNGITGYQFTLKFDRQALSFEGIEAGVLDVNESNFGTNRVSDGILTTSWDSKTALSADANANLFTVVFRANSKSNIGSLVAITSDVTAAEAYDADLHIKDVSLGVRTNKGIVESGIFELYQNQPNPFEKETAISFRLPEAGAVKLSIYDVTGKVLRVYEIAGVKGMNSQKVLKSELNATGVLYYQLDAADHTATKRMVVIE